MSRDVARLFDAMAQSYDALEPWYEHLYDMLHAILRAELRPGAALGRPRGHHPRALDAGCGTGFQTAVLESLGYQTHGVDLSSGLLAVARRKLPSTTLISGNIEELPYLDRSFDVVTCCGSTLSFVEDPGAAVREMSRVLRPGGTLVIECEHKWSVDLAWAFLSSVTFDSLGYGVTIGEAWQPLARPLSEGFVLRYPYVTQTGAREWMRLRLFTKTEIRRMLVAAGLVPEKAWGIHAITNLIPSTVLHRQRLGRVLAAVFGVLRAADRRRGSCPPAPALANSVVVRARKTG
jgi:ubiquinone/menaquinone biosynthesis C-methylase UbiE